MRFARHSFAAIFATVLPLLLGSTALVGPGRASAETIRVGDPAPEFSFLGTDGLAYTSSDYFLGTRESAGRGATNASQTAIEAKAQARGGEPGRGVVIAWFPKAFTGG